MAIINSKLILYDNETLFRQDLALTGTAKKILPTSIVFMKDTGRLWTQGNYFGGGVWENMLGKPDMSDYASALDGNVIPMVIGTQTTTTASWTGVLPLSELKSGTTIRYWLPRTSASGVTLNLTLKGGGSTGAINCYYGGTTRLTTHYPAGSFIMLTYLEGALINGTAYTGWWAKANYVDGSESYTVRWNASVKAGAQITRYKLLVQGSDGRYYPTTVGDTTAGTKTISTVPFLIGSPIIFYLYTPTIASGGVTSAPYNYTGVTTSTTTYAWNKVSGWRANEDVYLKGTVSGALFTLDNSTLTSHMTQDLPTTEDGFYYMRLGMFTNTTTGFRLSNQHPTYYFADGELQSLNTSHGADWNELLNKPTTFAPSAHTHTIAQITGLQGALDLKSPLANPTFTGNVTAPTFIGALTGLASLNLPLTGGTLSGTLNSTTANTVPAIYKTTNTGTAVLRIGATTYDKGFGLGNHGELIFGDWSSVSSLSSSWDKLWHSGNFANGTTAQYIRGDGSLATYANTTYSAMSVAEGQEGTATSSRTVRADYLKQIIQHYDSVTGIRAGASGTNANSSTSNPYIKVLDGSTYKSQIRLSGSGATSVSSDASGNITISSTNTTYDVATTSTNGLMSGTDKTNLNFNTSARHYHTNTATLDKITEVGGELKYNGETVVTKTSFTWARLKGSMSWAELIGM